MPKKLEVGDKYLTISLFDGQVKLAAFKNQDKKKDTEPDYSGNGIAIWINQKKAPVEKVNNNSGL